MYIRASAYPLSYIFDLKCRNSIQHNMYDVYMYSIKRHRREING